MGDCGHPPPPTCHSLLIDFHHEVWVIQEPGIFSEVLIGDHVLVELLWAQRQRVRADTAMSHIICPIPSYRPPVGQVVDLATYSPSCGFYTCSHSRIYRLGQGLLKMLVESGYHGAGSHLCYPTLKSLP